MLYALSIPFSHFNPFMKTILRPFKASIFVCLLLLACVQISNGQAPADAGSYMSFIGQQYREINKDFLSYSSAVAHGKSARKVENRRQTLMKTVTDARRKITTMGAYQGDKSLRDSTVTYLTISYHVLNDDYGKIMNLEEVAEQSYDAMEAYLLAQDIAGRKVEEAGTRLRNMERSFASKHKINLIENKDELSEKLEKTTKVNEYQRTLYLIFFKNYKQELYMLDAVQNRSINAIEQNKNSLIQYTQEGLSKLDTIHAFNGDRSLVTATKQVLEFYKQECTQKMSIITDFYLKEENFNKIKKAFEAKREKERTQADVNQYNKALEEMNKGISEFNKTNQQLYSARKDLIDNWNKVSQNLLDKHTPKSR
jgi:hypothetical protein